MCSQSAYPWSKQSSSIAPADIERPSGCRPAADAAVKVTTQVRIMPFPTSRQRQKAIISSPSTAAGNDDLRSRRPNARPPSLNDDAKNDRVNSEESTCTSEAFLSLTSVGTSLLCKSPIAALEVFRDNRRPRGGMGPLSPPAHIAAMGECLARPKGDDSPPAPSLVVGHVAESVCPKSLISRAMEFNVSSCWRNLFKPRVRGFVVSSSKGLGFIQGTAMG